MREDVLRQVLEGPMRDPGFRALADGDLAEELRRRGLELDELELKAVRQIRAQAQGLDGEDLDRFLEANASLDPGSGVRVQGPDLTVVGEMPEPAEDE